MNKNTEKEQNERIPLKDKIIKEKNLGAKDKNEGSKELIENKSNLSK